MPLESTIICVDNSEYMRNGDYLPNRLQAQQDAVNTVCRSKLLANPENNVGLLTLANTEVLVTLTTDAAKILTSLHRVQPEGYINLLTGIRIAHLALKHRQSKNHKMRIVVFVGSPIGADEKEVIKIAKRLKKENVTLDVINFGEVDANKDLLEAMVNTLNGREGAGSHLVTVPPSPHLSDALLSSPIVQGEDGAGPGANFSTGGGFEFGVDPNEDPELALALRVSMEEQRQRQQQEEERRTGTTGTTEAQPAVPMDTDTSSARLAGEVLVSSSAGALSGSAEDTAAGDQSAKASQPGPTEEEMLQQALAMSLEAGDEGVVSKPPETKVASTLPTSNFPDFSSMTEEEQIAYAMQISLEGCKDQGEAMEVDEPAKTGAKGGNATTKDAPAKNTLPSPSDVDISEVMSDAAFLQNVLQSLPGVNPNSQVVQEAVGSLSQQEKDKKNKKDKDNEDKKEADSGKDEEKK